MGVEYTVSLLHTLWGSRHDANSTLPKCRQEDVPFRSERRLQKKSSLSFDNQTTAGPGPYRRPSYDTTSVWFGLCAQSRSTTRYSTVGYRAYRMRRKESIGDARRFVWVLF
jgi:hypothetical protein